MLGSGKALLRQVIGMAPKLNAPSGSLVVIDAIVLIAMAITAVAFTAGLILHSHVDLIPGVVAGAALYMVMASAHFVVTRSARSAAVSGRIDQLENALLVLDADLQRIDKVEDDVARLDLLNDRVEQLDRSIAGPDGIPPAHAMGQIERLSTDFEELHARLESLRGDIEGEARSQRNKISGELRLLEGLITQLSRDLASPSRPSTVDEIYRPQASAPPSGEILMAWPAEQASDSDDEALPEREAALVEEVILALEQPLELGEGELEPLSLETEEAHGDERVEAGTPLDRFVAETPLDLTSEHAPSAEASEAEPEAAGSEPQLLDTIREAIKRTRVELYLQPVLTLPERKLRYYEALSRIRSSAGELILPSSFVPLAKSSGLMPLIDNLLLVKSVQFLRRIGPDSKVKGVFCSLSVQSLLDSEYFPELVEFLEENGALSDSLFFELSQAAVAGLSSEGLQSLDTLGKLGYRFALDHVADLDIDFAGLRDRPFRFVKLGLETYLRGRQASAVFLDDLQSHLRRFELELIVDKVDDETELSRLLETGVELAQGRALGEPRPVSPEMVRELEEADAA